MRHCAQAEPKLTFPLMCGSNKPLLPLREAGTHQNPQTKQHAETSHYQQCPCKALGEGEQRSGPSQDQQRTHEECEDHPPPGILSENLSVELPRPRLLLGERGGTRSCKDHAYDDQQHPQGAERVPRSTADQQCACCETREEGERGTGEHYSSCNDEKETNQAPMLHHGVAGSTRESGGNVMLG